MKTKTLKFAPTKAFAILRVSGMLLMADVDGDSPCRDCMRFGSCENCIYG